jgi:Lipocalin-like domain
MENERICWLAGCWDLVECTFTAGDGTARVPWGAAPIGVLLVTPSGELSAHVGRRDRAPFAGEHPTPDEKQQAYDDYFSYFARIVRVDDEASTFVTAVDGATNPDWIGGEQLRYLEVEDDSTIVLRTPPLALAGSEVVGRLVWRRRGGGTA